MEKIKFKEINEELEKERVSFIKFIEVTDELRKKVSDENISNKEKITCLGSIFFLMKVIHKSYDIYKFSDEVVHMFINSLSSCKIAENTLIGIENIKSKFDLQNSG